MTGSVKLAANMALVKPPIAILGVPFDNVTTASALKPGLLVSIRTP